MPKDDYVIAEFTKSNPSLDSGRKSGVGMKIFFKFNTWGLVEDVVYAGFVYN